MATINIPLTHSLYIAPLLQQVPLIEPIRQWLLSHPQILSICTMLLN